MMPKYSAGSIASDQVHLQFHEFADEHLAGHDSHTTNSTDNSNGDVSQNSAGD